MKRLAAHNSQKCKFNNKVRFKSDAFIWIFKENDWIDIYPAVNNS